jgi:hypothetical protein
VITSQVRTATPPAPVISDRPYSVRPMANVNAHAVHDSLLAKAADEAQIAWANKTAAPPAPKRRGVELYIAAGTLLLIAALWLWFGRSGQPVSQSRPTPAHTLPTPQPPAATIMEPTPVAAGETPQQVPSPSDNALPSQAAPQPTAAPAPTTEETVAKAEQLKQQGKEKQAIALYERAITQAPQDSVLPSRLAFMHLNRGRNAEAVTFAARATQADASNSEAWIVLGAARDALGDRKAAKEAYRNCADQGRGAYVTECKRMLR